jgi:hypothetical protein
MLTAWGDQAAGKSKASEAGLRGEKTDTCEPKEESNSIREQWIRTPFCLHICICGKSAPKFSNTFTSAARNISHVTFCGRLTLKPLSINEDVIAGISAASPPSDIGSDGSLRT